MKYNFDYIFPEMDGLTRQEAAVQRLLDKELSYQTFDNAYVLPSKDLWKNGKCYGGIVTKDGQFVESSAWHEGARCDKYEFDPKEAQKEDNVVIYLGFYNGCWGHAITDNLKKLWFLKTDACKELLRKGAKIIYLTVDNQKQPLYVYRLFELAGCDLSQFQQITSLSSIKTVIVPDNSFIADHGQRYFTKEYINTINDIKKEVLINSTDKQKSIDKLYFTRSHLHSFRDIGEKSIEKVFKSKGYKIVAPEEYSVDAQIRMLMNCSSFATTEGSISHNVVFCNNSTNIFIVRKCYDVNKYQMAVNEVADVNVTIIDSHRSINAPKTAPWVGPFYLYCNNKIKKCLEYSHFTFPYWLKISWYFYKYENSRIVRKLKQIINK